MVYDTLQIVEQKNEKRIFYQHKNLACE